MSHDVLILTDDAERYLPLLAAVQDAGGRLAIASTTSQAREIYHGETVLLGRPDLAAEVLEQLPEVRWVQSSWAGVTPLLRVKRRDFQLTGVKGVFGAEMAEYVFGYLLAHTLRLQERRAQQDRREWWVTDSGTLEGRVLGIMGTGSIGRHIARTAVAFGMRVTGFSRRGRPCEGFERVYPCDALQEFLAGADHVVCVLPDTPETGRVLDGRAFRAMQPGACLVNVGRGNAIDEAALVAALHAGDIAAAVLDVFEQEPLPAASPLWDCPGVTVTAHVAARSHPEDIARIFLRNYNRFVAGQPLEYLVDLERGY